MNTGFGVSDHLGLPAQYRSPAICTGRKSELYLHRRRLIDTGFFIKESEPFNDFAMKLGCILFAFLVDRGRED